MNNFSFSGVLFGDLVYDQYVRFHYNFKTNFFSLKLLKLIFSKIFKKILLKNIIKDKKIKYLIVSSYIYATLSILAIRIGAKMGIKVIIIAGNYYHYFEDYNDTLKGYYKVTKNRLNDFKST